AEAAPGETLAELHGRYLAEQQVSEEWKLTNGAVMRLFIDHIGHRTAASAIARKDVRAWKDALLKFPSRGTLRHPSASFQEIIKFNETEKKPAISIKTINKYLSV